jgi:hypothetical protein
MFWHLPSFNPIPNFETLDSVALCGLQIGNGNTNLPVCAAHGAPHNFSYHPQKLLLHSNSPAGTNLLIARKHNNYALLYFSYGSHPDVSKNYYSMKVSVKYKYLFIYI